ncbi:E3 ubiquitin-protein ligase RNF31 isoform X3 [Girardinichthys multiradiatus]|uniref:E3 ubiquitin-protein ligase RNF31 isoform X3 n=1 Tax=Girardinichthys multiradiatus TaxID=208333 RepID=UPI001FAC9174|nr:E3 ubiquitin-protein ligase RNF31 isoform X3 [Girardinichthys multiradiatus]
MPLVGPELERRTLTECRYRYPTETLKDLQSVRARFPDLRLCVDFYCFPNNEKRKLVHLSGTLPVLYQGSQYNVPVCIWLHETHPASRPRCFVCPSVSMVINLSCPYVDSSGTITLDGLKNWTPGVSNLSLLLSEMVLAFQKDTPLYARCVAQAPPPAGVQVSVQVSSSSLQSQCLSLGSSYPAPLKASHWGQGSVRTSYTEELIGIDFSAPPSSCNTNPFLSSSSSGVPLTEALSRMMGTLSLDRDRKSELAQHGSGAQSPQSGPATEADLRKMSDAGLSPDQAAVFLALISMNGRSFNPDDVIEAVQHNQDFPSALKFLTHTCPICHDQVSFSKERSVDQLTCPQCGQPEIRGQGALEESMDYFNLLDTQIRHFLPPDVHELFQRKLRDRALQEMPNFCWCAHCSFGMLHESDRLRMDCPSCKKSTCSQCRSPWSPHHQGLSCEEFKLWQQQNQQDLHRSALLHTIIECPSCQFVFSLSKGGCLHFTCTQCRHQFCGGCSRCFVLGPACSFSAQCGSKGLHAHHPRDCLYHLRDWSVSRLHRLLQYYRMSPSWLEPSNGSLAQSSQTAACSVLELRDSGRMTKEEPCGRPALSEYRGYCQGHYKERLVELINRCCADPALLFTPAEMIAELQRWNVAVPIRRPEEPDLLYAHRLRLVLTNNLPLRKRRHTPSVTSVEAPPPP